MEIINQSKLFYMLNTTPIVQNSNLNIINTITPFLKIKYTSYNKIIIENNIGTSIYQFQYFLNNQLLVEYKKIPIGAKIIISSDQDLISDSSKIIYHYFKNKKLNTLYIFNPKFLSNIEIPE